MIIYPIAIIVILLVVFVLVWRRAYFVEQEGLVPDEIKDEASEEKFLMGADAENPDPSQDDGIRSKKRFSLFKFKRHQEPEVAVEKTQDPLMEKAEELFFKKQYISAEKWYLEVIKKDPRNPKIYSRLGLIYINQKNYKDAIASLEEANKIEPTVASRYFNLSFAHNEEGDRKEALDSARKAIRLDPKNSKYKKWFDELKSRPF